MQAVLTYHSIDESGSAISLTPAQFRQQIQSLTRRAVSVQPLATLLAMLGEDRVSTASTATDAVALTFDDGFVNFADHAVPLLQEHALPATVFVVSDHVGGDNQWGGRASARVPVLPLLNWDALGRLAESGIEIGAHTRTHPHLFRLSDAQIEDELFGSADVIEQRLGRRPRSFAYPFGESDARVEQVARRAFMLSCTTEYRSLRTTEDAARVPRLDAWYFRDAGSFASWGSSSFRLRIALRRGARRGRRFFSPD